MAPGAGRDAARECPSTMLAVNGIHILENMKLDELASKRVHEFAFVMQPMKLQGFTGSTVTPIAIR